MQVMSSISGFVQLDRAELQRVDLAQVVTAVVYRERGALRPDTDVVHDLAPGLVIEIDPRRVSEALATLIRNAGESFDGPGKLTIRLATAEATVHIDIEDTGRGMTADLVDGLFDIDFSHGERTRARFGLPLCRSIVQRHGGSVGITSEPGVGTTARIRLPSGDPDA